MPTRGGGGVGRGEETVDDDDDLEKDMLWQVENSATTQWEALFNRITVSSSCPTSD